MTESTPFAEIATIETGLPGLPYREFVNKKGSPYIQVIRPHAYSS